MSTECPFKIAIPDHNLISLRAKLDLAAFPDELDEAGWQYGAPLADVKRLVARWKSGYDWRAREALINDELPQFTRDIEVEGHGTLNIHYVHKRSEVVDAIPLLFVHGWPGSFLEVQKILPLLTATSPEHPSFHVVALSLPGYGFSEAPRKKDFKLAQYAEARGNKLMVGLEYNEYVTQGGDWGYFITRKIASAYGGKHSKAWHTNLPLGALPHPVHRPWLLLKHLLFMANIINPYTPAEVTGLERGQRFEHQETGYIAIQSTKPQTLGYSLADSPVGLLAWIYEKMVLGAEDGYKWDDDEVLTWVSVYLFSRAGPAASLRIYIGMAQDADIILPPSSFPISPIPLGISFFPGEIFRMPIAWIRAMGHLVHTAEHDSGGHFASTEKPEELVGDLRKMFGKGGPAFGVVSGCLGY